MSNVTPLPQLKKVGTLSNVTPSAQLGKVGTVSNVTPSAQLGNFGTLSNVTTSAQLGKVGTLSNVTPSPPESCCTEMGSGVNGLKASLICNGGGSGCLCNRTVSTGHYFSVKRKESRAGVDAKPL